MPTGCDEDTISGHDVLDLKPIRFYGRKNLAG
jgi:hypothetical protein